MSLYRRKQVIKSQIIETENLIEMVGDHPFMGLGLNVKLGRLKEELQKLDEIKTEPKIQLLFSGNAVIGSQGIKSSFIAKTMTPFQEMVKTQFAFERFGNVGGRGQVRNAVNTELYLTSLPLGSFGIELSQLQSTDLFATIEISNAIQKVITLVINASTSDEVFEETAQNTPKRNLNNLKKFLHEIVEENSVLKMESGNLGVEITTEKVKEAYYRVSSTTDIEDETIIRGIFRGMLLDSERFEVQDENGLKYSGYISEDISEEQLIQYSSFLNTECQIHLLIHKTTFKTGNEKTEYELLEISPIK